MLIASLFRVLMLMTKPKKGKTVNKCLEAAGIRGGDDRRPCGQCANDPRFGDGHGLLLHSLQEGVLVLAVQGLHYIRKGCSVDGSIGFSTRMSRCHRSKLSTLDRWHASWPILSNSSMQHRPLSARIRAPASSANSPEGSRTTEAVSPAVEEELPET